MPRLGPDGYLKYQEDPRKYCHNNRNPKIQNPKPQVHSPRMGVQITFGNATLLPRENELPPVIRPSSLVNPAVRKKTYRVVCEDDGKNNPNAFTDGQAKDIKLCKINVRKNCNRQCGCRQGHQVAPVNYGAVGKRRIDVARLRRRRSSHGKNITLNVWRGENCLGGPSL